MAMTLGAVTFDEAYTTAQETYDEVGGRDERVITLSGLILGETTVVGVEARLDAVLDAASDADYAELSVRDGRVMQVRRESFKRTLNRAEKTGSFELVLAARDPYEYAETETTVSWPVSASGVTLLVSPGGNVYAQPAIALSASGTVVAPTFSDGTRSIGYTGSVADGSALLFDAAAGTVVLDGADVTPYCVGDFPRLDPGGTTLTYTDDTASSHTASVTVKYRDRWW